MRSCRSPTRTAFGGPFGPAGVHRDEPAFDRRRYWRGPVWPQLAYLLWLAGAPVAETTVRGSASSGLAEFWDPDDGTGLGASPQSWTCLSIVLSRKSATSRRVERWFAVAPLGAMATHRMSGGAALAADEVDDHIDRRHEHDEIAERQHLLDGGHGNDVAQHHQPIIPHPRDGVRRSVRHRSETGLDDIGVDECLGVHRHALVEHDRDDVRAQADGHNTHPGQVEIGDREPTRAARARATSATRRFTLDARPRRLDRQRR